MKTMATSTAANKSSRCLTTTTSTCKASSHGQESIASKSGTNGIDPSSFPNGNILREIPTRNSRATPDTTIVDAFNADDDHHQHQHPSHSRTNVDMTTTASTVSKADSCGIDNTSSTSSTLLRENPTRNSQLFSTAAVDDHLDDDNEQRQHQTFSFLPDENKMTLLPRTSSCNDDDSFDYKSELAAITARCERMQQQWPLLLASSDTNRVIKDDTQSPECTPPEPSSPWPTDTTMANEALCHPLECPVTFEPHSLIHQSQSLLDKMKKQSQALRNLTVLSDKLLSLMTCVVSEVDKLVAVQPPHMILVPSTPHCRRQT